MKDKQAKYPQLRFKGFTDPWEQRKLSDIADRFDNLRVPITASDRKPGDTPYYGANGIQDYVEGFTHNGEFILVAEDGANDLKNYPVQYVNGKVWINNHAHVLQGKKTITDNKFLMNAIKNFNIEPFLVGGGRAKLNADVMMKLNILLPTLVEQEKIGSLFSLLDKTIAANQRKLDLLKEQKQGYLQKLFPKNGSKFPQLRFAGFADAWEQRKLGNELTLLKDGTHGTHQNVLEGPFLLSAKNIKNGKIIIDEITDRKISVEEYNSIHKKFSLEKGDVLLTIVGSIGETAIIENPIGITFQRSVAYLRPSHTILSQFLFTTINGQKFQMELRKRQVVSAQPGIYLGDLSIIPILIPSVAEQEKIGSFFKQLDETIALHQRKLDLLKEQKKGFLQKMFV